MFVIYAKEFKKGVLRVSICAPTGVAASQLGGYTIHNLFTMDFHQGKF